MQAKFKLDSRKVAIILLALATAIVHLVVLNLRMLAVTNKIDPLFTINGIGYLVLLIAYFAPAAVFKKYHNLVRWAFVVYAALTILAWALITGFDLSDPLGLVTKAIEIFLIVFLVIDR